MCADGVVAAVKSVRWRWQFVNCYKLLLILLLAAELQRTKAEYGDVAGQWQVVFDNNQAADTIYLGIGSQRNISVHIADVDLSSETDFNFVFRVENSEVAWITMAAVGKEELQPMPVNASLGEWHGVATIEGKRLGYTEIYVKLYLENKLSERGPQEQKLAIKRNRHLDDKIFAYTAPSLVLLMFVNLGTVLDLQRLKGILLRPIGPFIGVFARYALMPALGLGLGMLLFPNNKYLRLALFYTALSPSGGLANICAVFLKGNINLSIAATTINSLFALAMMPLWIFILMEVVSDQSNLTVPFLQLAVGSVALILAITFGVLLRVFFPKTTSYIFRFLKPLSVILSLCLVGLTVGINVFIFKHITGMIFLAAICLPIIGFALTVLLCRVCRLSQSDSLTLAIETSVLNMTVPIMLLQQSFEQPMADLVIVVPIISALVSLFLVLVLYTIRRIFGWNNADEHGFDDKKLITDSESLDK